MRGHLAVCVHGEVRVFLEERARPIGSVRYGLMEVGIDLDEHSAVLDGPDVLRVAIPEVRRIGGPGPSRGTATALPSSTSWKWNAPVSSK